MRGKTPHTCAMRSKPSPRPKASSPTSHECLWSGSPAAVVTDSATHRTSEETSRAFMVGQSAITTRRGERKTNVLARQMQEPGVDLQPLGRQEEPNCSSAFREAPLLSAATSTRSSSSHTLGIHLHLPHCRKKIPFFLIIPL